MRLGTLAESLATMPAHDVGGFCTNVIIAGSLKARRVGIRTPPVTELKRFEHGFQLRERGEFDLAAREILRELQRIEPSTPASRLVSSEARVILASTLLDLNRPHDAERHARDAIRELSRLESPDDQRVAIAQRVLGRCILDCGRLDEAEPIIRRTYDRLRDSKAPPAVRAAAIGDWAEVRLIRGMIHEAEPLLIESIDESSGDLTTSLRRFQHRRLIEKLVTLYDNSDRPEEAAGWRAIMDNIDTRPDSPTTTQPAP